MTNDLLITGIPRSGTSYLCSILNKVHNTVVVNEPEEVLQILRNDSDVPLSQYYKHIRHRINSAQPIKNKLVNGEFIEDTNIHDGRTAYIPQVDITDFVLGTKNTLVYLNTLERILEDLPDATLVACVRHPYDTVASWSKVSFPHIRNAAPQFLLDYTTGEVTQSIERVLQKTELAVRYAMWWNHLAGIINNNLDRLILINYENMVSNPEATIARIYEAIPFPTGIQQPLEPSSPRHHKNALDSDSISTINAMCKDLAELLGYTL